MQESFILISLDFPVEFNGQALNQLKLRRPKVRDRLIAEKVGGSNLEKELRFIANLCEVAPEVVESLDMVDYYKLQEALSDFLS